MCHIYITEPLRVGEAARGSGGSEGGVGEGWARTAVRVGEAAGGSGGSEGGGGYVLNYASAKLQADWEVVKVAVDTY